MSTIQDRLTTVAASAAVAFSALSFSPVAPQAQAQNCVGDNNGDGVVNGVDLAHVLADWGACQSPLLISSVTPSGGPTVGGTAITILGSGFSTVTSVMIGGIAATNVMVVSATLVTAVTPPGTVGAKNVVVITPVSTATAIGAFTYTGLAWATVLEWVPNAAVVTDATLRNAIIASGLPWRVRDNASNIEMLLVPAGTFTMGCSPGDTECQADESPVHQVTLTNAFYMGKTEVTQAQWLAEMGSNPSYYGGQPNNPVEQVSQNMAQSFNTATGLRLPSEAEWEYACRGGNLTSRYGPIDGIAWHLGNAGGQTHAVATKIPNALGFYDMIGNVWEWNKDWYGAYAPGAVSNPTGPASGQSIISRGGSWGWWGTNWCRASSRLSWGPEGGDRGNGFRVARNP